MLTLRDFLDLLARRKLVILFVAVLTPLAAVVGSLQQQKLYQASAEVLLTRKDLAATLSGTIDASVYEEADRIAETQANVARVPAVARRVLKAAGASDKSAREFLEASEFAP